MSIFDELFSVCFPCSLATFFCNFSLDPFFFFKWIFRIKQPVLCHTIKTLILNIMSECWLGRCYQSWNWTMLIEYENHLNVTLFVTQVSNYPVPHPVGTFSQLLFVPVKICQLRCHTDKSHLFFVVLGLWFQLLSIDLTFLQFKLFKIEYSEYNLLKVQIVILLGQLYLSVYFYKWPRFPAMGVTGYMLLWEAA